ncbi:MAG: sugar transferase [Anaerolineales bacterium]|nr:sugar transferase [Anaerolineales bacterium]
MTIINYLQPAVSRNWIYPTSRDDFLHKRIYKRVIDLAVCIPLLPFAMVLMVILAICVMVDSSGSPFFAQERIGRWGRRFRMYKFRTMTHTQSSKDEQNYMKKYVSGQIKADGGEIHKPIKKHDVTRLGKFLRKSSLDELPQILNVLKGEMSLIGPRPNVPWEVEAYAYWHYERLHTLPGITGLAQVMGRSSLSFDEIVRFDIRYVRLYGPPMDLWIVWRTIAIVFSGRGAG